MLFLVLFRISPTEHKKSFERCYVQDNKESFYTEKKKRIGAPLTLLYIKFTGYCPQHRCVPCKVTNFCHKRPSCLYQRELLVWRCHKKKKNEPCLQRRLSRLFLTRKFVPSVPASSFPIVSIFPWSTGSKLMEGSTQGVLLVIAERHLGVRRRYRPAEDGENKTPFTQQKRAVLE